MKYSMKELRKNILMAERNYYAERKGNLKPINFQIFKKLFLEIYQEFENKFYFREATGYSCVQGETIQGLWGPYIETFIFSKIKLSEIWPIQKNIEKWYDFTLFAVIEFLYDYVSEPQENWSHPYDYDRKHCYHS